MSIRPFNEVSVRQYGPAPGNHQHDYFQVLYAVEGSLELEVEGRGMLLHAQNGLLIYPGERHDFYASDRCLCLVLDTIAPEWTNNFREPKFGDAVSSLSQFLFSALGCAVPFSTDYGAQLLAQVWGSTVNQFPGYRQIDWPKLTSWVSMRLSAPLTAADLAAQTHLSESHFRARCIAQNGCAPMQWVRHLRIARAINLRAAGMSATDAAERVGYGSPAALSAAMRRSGYRPPAKRDR